MSVKKISSDPQKTTQSREIYVWYKSHKICVNCHENEVYNGGVYCLQCRMDINERRRGNRKLTTEQIAHRNEHNHRRKDLYAAFGVCVNCCKRDVVPGRSRCSVCLAKDRQREENKRRSKGIPSRSANYSDLCSLCMKGKAIKNKKLCQSCYDKSLKSIAYARSFINKKEHIWKAYNTADFFKRGEE